MATMPFDTTIPSAFPPLSHPPDWTVADLLDQLGGIPPERVRMTPWPGTATEKDVIEMDDRGGPLCELVDGTLVEKTMGVYESWLAVRICYFISSYLEKHNIGIVTGPDGFYKLFPKIVRGPDVTFVRYDRLPDGRVPRDPIPALAPTLPIEVLSRSNTKREMERKLREYFNAGAELVWYIDPETQSATVYTAPDQPQSVGPDGVIEGGAALPGFELPLRRLFAESEDV
jgi:Uma2 family endonuclease